MIQKIKISSERNTGTNYLVQLIENNFVVDRLGGEQLTYPLSYIQKTLNLILPGKFLKGYFFVFAYPFNLGWKHGCVDSPQQLRKYPIVKKNSVFIIIVKNLYSWLLSLQHRPHQNIPPMSFSDFIRSQWRTLPPDRLARKNLENPLPLWNEKVGSYSQVIDHMPSMVIRYEDLLENAEVHLQALSEKFNITRKTMNFVNWFESTKKDYHRDLEYYREYYLKEILRDKITSADIQYIYMHLNPDLIKKYILFHNLFIYKKPTIYYGLWKLITILVENYVL